jgi:hypothetical protein
VSRANCQDVAGRDYELTTRFSKSAPKGAVIRHPDRIIRDFDESGNVRANNKIAGCPYSLGFQRLWIVDMM